MWDLLVALAAGNWMLITDPEDISSLATANWLNLQYGVIPACPIVDASRPLSWNLQALEVARGGAPNDPPMEADLRANAIAAEPGPSSTSERGIEAQSGADADQGGHNHPWEEAVQDADVEELQEEEVKEETVRLGKDPVAFTPSPCDNTPSTESPDAVDQKLDETPKSSRSDQQAADDASPCEPTVVNADGRQPFADQVEAFARWESAQDSQQHGDDGGFAADEHDFYASAGAAGLSYEAAAPAYAYAVWQQAPFEYAAFETNEAALYAYGAAAAAYSHAALPESVSSTYAAPDEHYAFQNPEAAPMPYAAGCATYSQEFWSSQYAAQSTMFSAPAYSALPTTFYSPPFVYEAASMPYAGLAVEPRVFAHVANEGESGASSSAVGNSSAMLYPPGVFLQEKPSEAASSMMPIQHGVVPAPGLDIPDDHYLKDGLVFRGRVVAKAEVPKAKARRQKPKKKHGNGGQRSRWTPKA